MKNQRYLYRGGMPTRPDLSGVIFSDQLFNIFTLRSFWNLWLTFELFPTPYLSNKSPCIFFIHTRQSEKNVTDQKYTIFTERYNWETPLLTGRVLTVLASEPNIIRRTGRVHIVAELARQYGLVDQDGNLPVSLRSLRFLIPSALPLLKDYSWLIPDINVPWSLLLLGLLSSPKI